MKAVLSQHQIYGLVASDLERVEEELKSYARSPVGLIAEIANYLIEAGGKRVRPALVLLTARMLGDVTPSMIRLAAVTELIHNATLVHDDVIDESDTRRGRPSANSNWGNAMTVLAGDWLYMQSFAVALRERSFEVLGALIEITQKMVEGELLQLTLLRRSDVTKEQLLDIVERKTAWLFSGCMRLPAIVAGEDEASIAKFARIGMDLGMSFQLVDDLLDWTSTKEVLGKPAASDLTEGKVTLPVYFALSHNGGNPANEINRILEERDFGPATVRDVRSLVEQADGVARTRAIAETFSRRAVGELESLAPSVYRDAILHIPEFILNREA